MALKVEVVVPEKVSVSISSGIVSVKGPEGEVKKELKLSVELKVEENKVVVTGASKANVHTARAHIKHMIAGVQKQHRKKLKALFAHFPITIEVKGKMILFKNFLGEKKPRESKIIGIVKVEVKGKDMTLSSCDKEAIGQTCANIKSALKIKKKDSRVFQDGVYEVEDDE